MTVKTITIKEDAYNALKSMKRPDESFSDLILRKYEKKVTAKDLFGLWKDRDIDIEKVRKDMRRFREEFDKDMEKRRHVFARHINDN